jgi:hypothetical protein
MADIVAAVIIALAVVGLAALLGGAYLVTFYIYSVRKMLRGEVRL